MICLENKTNPAISKQLKRSACHAQVLGDCGQQDAPLSQHFLATMQITPALQVS